MCYNGFTIVINLFKSKRFEDGRCTYKNTGSSYLKEYYRVLIFLQYINSEIFQDTAFFKILSLALDIYEPKSFPRGSKSRSNYPP